MRLCVDTRLTLTAQAFQFQHSTSVSRTSAFCVFSASSSAFTSASSRSTESRASRASSNCVVSSARRVASVSCSATRDALSLSHVCVCYSASNTKPPMSLRLSVSVSLRFESGRSSLPASTLAFQNASICLSRPLLCLWHLRAARKPVMTAHARVRTTRAPCLSAARPSPASSHSQPRPDPESSCPETV